MTDDVITNTFEILSRAAEEYYFRLMDQAYEAALRDELDNLQGLA